MHEISDKRLAFLFNYFLKRFLKKRMTFNISIDFVTGDVNGKRKKIISLNERMDFFKSEVMPCADFSRKIYTTMH